MRLDQTETIKSVHGTEDYLKMDDIDDREAELRVKVKEPLVVPRLRHGIRGV